MRKKQPVHPKLYIKEELIKSSNKIYQYLSNDFIDSERVIKEEVEITNQNDNSIYKKNQMEYKKLENFINIQKKVLNKHQKARNYDAEILNEYEKLKKSFGADLDLVIVTDTGYSGLKISESH
jgi:hypothetical protein